MSPRRAVLGIVIAAALAGLWLGWRVARLTEGDIIARAGQDWQDRGGDPAECRALPRSEPAWIAVLCGRPPDGRLYQADRLGRIAVQPLADPADAAVIPGAD